MKPVYLILALCLLSGLAMLGLPEGSRNGEGRSRQAEGGMRGAANRAENGEPLYHGWSASRWRQVIWEQIRFKSILRLDDYLLGRDGDCAAIPVLLALLEDDHSAIRDYALGCITLLGPKAKWLTPTIVRHVDDSSPRVRTSAASTLVAIGAEGEQVRLTLISAMQDVDGWVNMDIVRSYYRMTRDYDNVIPVLLDVLQRPVETICSNSDRCAAAEMFADMGPRGEVSIPPMIAIIRGETKYQITRARCSRALSRFGAKAKTAIPALQDAVKADDDTVRVEAALALWKLTGKDEEKYVAIIRPVLDSHNIFAIEAAIRALGEMGPKAKAAVPALLTIYKQRPEVYGPFFREYIQEPARQALKRIDPEATKRAGIP